MKYLVKLILDITFSNCFSKICQLIQNLLFSIRIKTFNDEILWYCFIDTLSLSNNFMMKIKK